MSFRTYSKWNPRGEALHLVAVANQIVEDYDAQGYTLTLRQLYYQFVSRDIIPNTERSYKRLGDTISKARMAGLLDWDAIVDRTRDLKHLPHWDDAGDVIAAAARSFNTDIWADQEVRVEVWVEKEALAGVIARAADAWDCAYFACKGYVSQSEQWRAARRIYAHIQGGQRVVILHLGDHDPSGIDMTRDIEERIRHFICTDYYGFNEDDPLGTWADDYDNVLGNMAEQYGGAWVDPYAAPFEVRRIALNWDQVQQYQPPPNPAKMTDSRAEGYVARFGRQSWELDALDPATLNRLIEVEIEDEVDMDKLAAARARLEEVREGLTELAGRPWEDVMEWLGS